MSCFPLVCEYALGIERGFFNVTASTYFGPGYEPWRGRLNHDAGIWRPRLSKDYEFLQFSFDHVMAITGLAIQGDSTSCGRVTRFYLHYGLDSKRFETYVDPVYKKVSTKLHMYWFPWRYRATVRAPCHGLGFRCSLGFVFPAKND